MNAARFRSTTARRAWGRRLILAGLGLLAAQTLLSLPLIAQSPRPATAAAIIPIHGEISDILTGSIQRRIEAARSQGIQTLVFELDTPGGLVTSALDICRLIKNLGADYRTVAWVRHEAYSAGAMISVACKEIVMSGSSALGDCAPIMVSPIGGLEELGAAERAKAESPVLQEFRDSATRNGYDPLLCRAMVQVSEEVWWLENSATQQLRFVTAQEKKTLIDDLPAEQRQWRLVESFKDVRSGNASSVRQPIDNPDTLLTLSQSEAVAFGIARAVVSDEHELRSYLGLSGRDAAFESLPISGWELFAMWLNSPLVRGILFVIVLVGGYIEFQHPGLILPGATAAVALVIFLAAPYAAGLADIWTIVLLLVGAILLAVELFVIPGFGVLGLLGVALMIVALLGTFVPREPGAPPFAWPTLDGTWMLLKQGVLVMSASVLVATVGIGLLIRYLPQLPGARKLLLENPDGAALTLEDPYPSAALPGDIGVVTGVLRPGGQARFGQQIVDVQSQGEYVDAGRRVVVVEHGHGRIVVRPLPEERA